MRFYQVACLKDLINRLYTESLTYKLTFLVGRREKENL